MHIRGRPRTLTAGPSAPRATPAPSVKSRSLGAGITHFSVSARPVLSCFDNRPVKPSSAGAGTLEGSLAPRQQSHGGRPTGALRQRREHECLRRCTQGTSERLSQVLGFFRLPGHPSGPPPSHALWWSSAPCSCPPLSLLRRPRRALCVEGTVRTPKGAVPANDTLRPLWRPQAWPTETAAQH